MAKQRSYSTKYIVFLPLYAMHMLHNLCSPCPLYCNACAAFNMQKGIAFLEVNCNGKSMCYYACAELIFHWREHLKHSCIQMCTAIKWLLRSIQHTFCLHLHRDSPFSYSSCNKCKYVDQGVVARTWPNRECTVLNALKNTERRPDYG